MAASSCATDSIHAPIASLEHFTWVPPGTQRPALADVTLHLAAGQCAVLVGPTGAGKSTLLRAIAGALPMGGAVQGALQVAGRAALMFQNVETQLLFSTVDEEVASGLRGSPEDPSRGSFVESALARAGLTEFSGRSVEDLSAGERQRVVLAALLATEPTLLLLDEPTSALDPSAREDLVAALAQLKARGHGLVVAEHVVHPFRALADRWLTLEAGRLTESAPVSSTPAPPRATARAPEGGLLRIRCVGAGLRDADNCSRLAPTNLSIHAGDRVLVCGANGAGKSTLLHLLAGFHRASEGYIEIGDAPAQPGVDRLRGPRARVALVLQSPPRNLFAASVGQELAFTLERSGFTGAQVERRVSALLDVCGLEGLRERSPLRLSFGEQHRVAIAAALAARPALLLLDEPFSGLDTASRGRLLALLDAEQAHTGMAVVIASHDATDLEAWAYHQLTLEAQPSVPGRPAAPRRHALDAAPRSRRARSAAGGRGCHFRDTGSAVHGLSVVWKMLMVALGSAAAIAAHSPLALAVLLAIWMAGYRVARLSLAELWQDTRWLALQGGAIVGLSLLCHGSNGLLTGLRAAAQIALFFLPGALLLRTTSTGCIVASAKRALPPRLSFALATSLRFVPFFAREIHEITKVQKLRGARLGPRDLWRPSAWQDAIACAALPLAVRTIHTANEIARAAEVRGIAAAVAREARP